MGLVTSRSDIASLLKLGELSKQFIIRWKNFVSTLANIMSTLTLCSLLRWLHRPCDPKRFRRACQVHQGRQLFCCVRVSRRAVSFVYRPLNQRLLPYPPFFSFPIIWVRKTPGYPLWVTRRVSATCTLIGVSKHLEKLRSDSCGIDLWAHLGFINKPVAVVLGNRKREIQWPERTFH